MVDAALETARGLGAVGDEIGEEVFFADEVREEAIRAPEPFVGVPPVFACG